MRKSTVLSHSTELAFLVSTSMLDVSGGGTGVEPGNAKERSITVPLTSCLTG